MAAQDDQPSAIASALARFRAAPSALAQPMIFNTGSQQSSSGPASVQTFTLSDGQIVTIPNRPAPSVSPSPVLGGSSNFDGSFGGGASPSGFSRSNTPGSAMGSTDHDFGSDFDGGNLQEIFGSSSNSLMDQNRLTLDPQNGPIVPPIVM